MTISEFMREYQIPKTKLYAVLKENNMSAADVREPSSTHISNDGMQKLASLFGEYITPASDPEPIEEQKTESNDTPAALELAVLKERVAFMEREMEILRAQIAKAEEDTRKAEAAAEEWKKLFTDMHNAQMKLLEAPKQSIWGRLFGRRKDS